jgi:hypothetical protein
MLQITAASRIWLTRRRFCVEFPVDALYEVGLFPKSKLS